ncbi:MAG: hypothetical protein ABIH26_00665 [Candidatus Eisenbacteria bacterium]
MTRTTRIRTVVLLSALLAAWALPLFPCAGACGDEPVDEGDRCSCVCHTAIALPSSVSDPSEPFVLCPLAAPLDPFDPLRDERIFRPPIA